MAPQEVVDSNLEKLREDTFNAAVGAVQQLFGSLDASSGRVMIAVVQWAALVLVAFALVSAAATGFGRRGVDDREHAGASPPRRAVAAFLAVHATLRLA